MTTQKNNQTVLQPNKDEILSNYKIRISGNWVTLHEFCDIVSDMNNDADLLEFVDFCYWNYGGDEASQLAIASVQNALYAIGYIDIAKNLGKLHMSYLAN